MKKVTARYTRRLTPHLEELLGSKPADHPLAKQFLLDERELITHPHELTDPIGDSAHSPVKGMVHRYRDRVLLKVHHACAAYCRFCFRREMIGHRATPLSPRELDAAIDYIRGRPEIWEVILTGGDPLALSARRLGDVLDRLSAIGHVNILRIHTRVPLVDPTRIDEPMFHALQTALPLYIALHVNHADELTPAVTTALDRLHDTRAVLLSQTVLLKGVNDDARTLETLFRRLVRLRVKPYYLHHPDLAPGTSHFRVSIEAGQAIVRTLRARLSGVCQPTYVLDIPGGYGKVPIGPTYVGEPDACGSRTILDAHGIAHDYPDVT